MARMLKACTNKKLFARSALTIDGIVGKKTWTVMWISFRIRAISSNKEIKVWM
ncbi:hypothetical protein [Fictibacillus sp. S7]|uniref:hypothetical protein n=1 Tax=Fictibacillus sp. S7 TaxID=2212476 RepID=UPI0013E9270D|nr:hypothetical protein [Fictibacillus sp. S7]